MSRFFSIFLFSILLTACNPFLYAEEDTQEEADKVKVVEKLDKKKLIEEINQQTGWSYEEKNDYLILSDYKRANINKDIFDEIEFLLSIYSAYYPFEKKEDLNAVRIFSKRKDYIDYVGKYKYYIWGKTSLGRGFSDLAYQIGENSSHVSRWYPKTKEMVILVGAKLPRNKKDYYNKISRIVKTSLFPQFIYSHSSCSSASVWFTQGNINFFRSIERKSQKSKNYGFNKNLYDRNGIKRLKKAIYGNYSFKLDNILTMDTASYLGKKEEERNSNYQNVRALMYYLLKGAPCTNKYEYALIPLKYMNALRNGTDPSKATEIAWEGIDKKKFEADFKAFWKKKTFISKSKKYDPLKDRKLKKMKADFLKKAQTK